MKTMNEFLEEFTDEEFNSGLCFIINGTAINAKIVRDNHYFNDRVIARHGRRTLKRVFDGNGKVINSYNTVIVELKGAVI